MANGSINRPSIPGKKNIGNNTSTTIIVAYKIADLTSSVALAIKVIGFIRAVAPWSNLSLLSTFSTPTTASSTNSPIAIVRPPSVMVLIDMPKYLNTKMVVSNETGIAVIEIKVVRQLARNRYKITMTTTEAAINLPCSVLMEDSIKVA